MEELEKWNDRIDTDKLSVDEESILSQMGLSGSSRRKFLKQASVASLSIWASTYFTSSAYANH